LPLLSYLEQAAAVQVEYDRSIARGEAVAEPGGLTVHPLLRLSAGRTGVRLSRFVVTAALAFGWYVARLNRVFMDCDVVLEAFYRSFGFGDVPGGAAVFQPHFGARLVALQATPDSLPSELRSEVEEFARQFHERGEVVLETRMPRVDRSPRREEPASRIGRLGVAHALA
jgi:hypothetical protein